MMSIISSSYIDRLDNKRKSKHFITKSGTHEVPVYEYQIIDGVKQLVCCGSHNLHDEIQSYAASTDIHNIINRFMNGETELLNMKNGVYADFTNMPTTYADLFSRVQQCENVFNSLPVELRNKFDNSYSKFWSDFGTDSFENIINDYNNSISVSPDDSGSVEGGSIDAE